MEGALLGGSAAEGVALLESHMGLDLAFPNLSTIKIPRHSWVE